MPLYMVGPERTLFKQSVPLLKPEMLQHTSPLGTRSSRGPKVSALSNKTGRLLFLVHVKVKHRKQNQV